MLSNVSARIGEVVYIFCSNKTSLGVDRVKPWNSMRINLGLDLRGLDLRPDLDNRHLIIEDYIGLRR